MKKILLISILFMGLCASLTAQQTSTFTVLDPSAPGLEQLQAQFSGQTNVLMNDNQKPAPYVIAEMLKGRQVSDLHLYVYTQPGVLGFQSVAITPANTAAFGQFFAEWKNSVSGKVIINSADIFVTAQGSALKALLEQTSGLTFTNQ